MAGEILILGWSAVILAKFGVWALYLSLVLLKLPFSLPQIAQMSAPRPLLLEGNCPVRCTSGYYCTRHSGVSPHLPRYDNSHAYASTSHISTVGFRNDPSYATPAYVPRYGPHSSSRSHRTTSHVPQRSVTPNESHKHFDPNEKKDLGTWKCL